MSLACLVCHGVESPSHSFRSYSVSSSDNEGGRRCSSMAGCLSRIPPHRGGGNNNNNNSHHTSFMASSSKVTPQPENSTGPPRLVRSHAVRRDIARDWNFDQVEIVGQ